MEKKRTISLWASIYLLVILAVILFFNVYVIVTHALPIFVIGACEGVLGCLAALFYALKGYSKNAAKYYKLYMVFVFLNYQMAVSSSGIRVTGLGGGLLGAACCLLAAFALTLALSHDLGKTTSMILCWGMVAVSFGIIVVMFLEHPGVFRGGNITSTAAIIRACSNCFLAHIALVMTYAKYKDKEVRGTK